MASSEIEVTYGPGWPGPEAGQTVTYERNADGSQGQVRSSSGGSSSPSPNVGVDYETGKSYDTSDPMKPVEINSAPVHVTPTFEEIDEWIAKSGKSDPTEQDILRVQQGILEKQQRDVEGQIATLEASKPDVEDFEKRWSSYITDDGKFDGPADTYEQYLAAAAVLDAKVADYNKQVTLVNAAGQGVGIQSRSLVGNTIAFNERLKQSVAPTVAPRDRTVWIGPASADNRTFGQKAKDFLSKSPMQYVGDWLGTPTSASQKQAAEASTMAFLMRKNAGYGATLADADFTKRQRLTETPRWLAGASIIPVVGSSANLAYRWPAMSAQQRMEGIGTVVADVALTAMAVAPGIVARPSGPSSFKVTSSYTGKTVKVPGRIEGVPLGEGAVIEEVAPGKFRPFTMRGVPYEIRGGQIRPSTPLQYGRGMEVKPFSWESAAVHASNVKQAAAREAAVNRIAGIIRQTGAKPVAVPEHVVAGGQVATVSPSYPRNALPRYTATSSTRARPAAAKAVEVTFAGDTITVPVDAAEAYFGVKGLGTHSVEVRAPWKTGGIDFTYDPGLLYDITRRAGFEVPSGAYWFGRGGAARPAGIINTVPTPVLAGRTSPLALSPVVATSSVAGVTGSAVSSSSVVTVAPTAVPSTTPSTPTVVRGLTAVNTPTRASAPITQAVTTRMPIPIATAVPTPVRTATSILTRTFVPSSIASPAPISTPITFPVTTPVSIPAVQPLLRARMEIPFPRFPGSVGSLSGGGGGDLSRLAKGNIGAWRVTGFDVFAPDPVTGEVVGGKVGRRVVKYGSVPVKNKTPIFVRAKV